MTEKKEILERMENLSIRICQIEGSIGALSRASRYVEYNCSDDVKIIKEWADDMALALELVKELSSKVSFEAYNILDNLEDLKME